MAETRGHPLVSSIEYLGRTTVRGIEEVGYNLALFIDILLWITFATSFCCRNREIFSDFYTDMRSVLGLPPRI